MFRYLRIAIALVVWLCISLLFIGIGQDWWGWLAKLQFLPSVFRVIGGATLGNIAILVGIVLITWVFGRIYCSVICPMGVFQDIVIWIRRQGGALIDKLQLKRLKARKAKGAPVQKVKLQAKHFSYKKEKKIIRYAVLAACVVSVIAFGQLFISFLAPYSAYGRMVRSIAGLAQGVSMAPALIVTAAVTLLVIGISAWFWGRDWCNVVCPVGTILGFVSRHSLFRITIDADKCTACGRCYRGCKASCIDGSSHFVDASRCVDCFDCIGRCKEGAVKYRFAAKAATASKSSKGVDRRAFLKSSGAALGALTVGAVSAKAQEMKVDGGLAPIEPKQAPERSCRLVPPGALSVKNLEDHCTSCQLCIAACPNGVLRASTDLKHLLQPEMGYENGYCRPECTSCSEVCPAGAIRPVDRDEKTAIRIGTAKVSLELCLAYNKEAGCGNCERHCPSGAIRMIRNDEGRRMPVVSEEQCIGCGACEHLCPVRPVSAITVDGLSTHITK